MINRFKIAAPVAAALGTISLFLALPISHSLASDPVRVNGPVIVELSNNGLVNGNHHDTTLFDDAILVPGRTETATMLVRNSGSVDGLLTATLADTEFNYEDGEYGVRVYDHIWVNVRVNSTENGAASDRLAQWDLTSTASDLANKQIGMFSGILPAGELVELAFDITFYLPPGADPVIGNRALVGLREMTFNVHLNLSDPEAGGPGDGGGSEGGNAGGGSQGSGPGNTATPGDRTEHPATGASIGYAVAAAALAGVGTVVAIRQRRQRDIV